MKNKKFNKKLKAALVKGDDREHKKLIKKQIDKKVSKK
jgi:hypothetical protein